MRTKKAKIQLSAENLAMDCLSRDGKCHEGQWRFAIIFFIQVILFNFLPPKSPQFTATDGDHYFLLFFCLLLSSAGASASSHVVAFATAPRQRKRAGVAWCAAFGAVGHRAVTPKREGLQEEYHSQNQDPRLASPGRPVSFARRVSFLLVISCLCSGVCSHRSRRRVSILCAGRHQT